MFGISMTGCDNSGDEVKDVPVAVKTAFDVIYPEGVHERWEREKDFYKAEFSRYGVASEAWFTSEGRWVRTETDFYGTLPQPVTDYIAAHYSGYAIDDCDLVEMLDLDYFDIRRCFVIRNSNNTTHKKQFGSGVGLRCRFRFFCGSTVF